jgi:uncharacterized membrane protein YfcA
MPVPENSGVDLTPREQSIVRPFRYPERNGVAWLLRSAVQCTAVAGIFLSLALARNEPRYAIGIFAMFVLYLAIRVYSARRIAGVMPRILQRYEKRIAELEGQLGKIDNDEVLSRNA